MDVRSLRLLPVPLAAVVLATGAVAQTTTTPTASTDERDVLYWLIAYAVGALVSYVVARLALAPYLAERRWSEAKRHAMRNAQLDDKRRLARYSNEWFRVYFEYDLEKDEKHILDFPPTGGAGHRLGDFLEFGLGGTAITVFGKTVTTTAAEQMATAQRGFDLVTEHIPSFVEKYWVNDTGPRDWVGNNATNLLILVGFVFVGGWLGMRSVPRLLRAQMEGDYVYWRDFRETLLAVEDKVVAEMQEEERKRAEKLEAERAWRANNEALLRALQGKSRNDGSASAS